MIHRKLDFAAAASNSQFCAARPAGQAGVLKNRKPLQQAAAARVDTAPYSMTQKLKSNSPSLGTPVVGVRNQPVGGFQRSKSLTREMTPSIRSHHSWDQPPNLVEFLPVGKTQASPLSATVRSAAVDTATADMTRKNKCLAQCEVARSQPANDLSFHQNQTAFISAPFDTAPLP